MKVTIAKNILGSFLGLYILNGEQRSRLLKESKDLPSLSLDELIGNLKVYEMIIKKDFKIVKAKGERRSLDLSGEEDDEKAKDETCLVAQASNESTTFKLTQFEKSTHSLNEMLSNQKPSGEKSGLGFNSFEASTSGTKEIKFVKCQKETSSGGGPPIAEGRP
ncbi:hypothetical protein Tco_0506019 [Tanacetum coccineum]